LSEFETAKSIISAIRSVRLEKNIPNKEKLILHFIGNHNPAYNSVLIKMANLDTIIPVKEKSAGATSFMITTTEYALPLGSLINAEEEITKMQVEIDYLQGFLKSVMVKLNNERFVANAKPQVVEAERKKKADTELKIKSLEDSILAMGN